MRPNPPLKKYWQGGVKKFAPPANITTRKRVDVLRDPTDFFVCVMGKMGFNTDYIAASAGLTPGQVQYRLTKGSVKRSDYRSGKSDLAKVVLNLAGDKCAGMARKELKAATHPAQELKISGERKEQ